MAELIDITDTISYPLDEVYPLYRDQLQELAAYLPNVDWIRCESREEPEPGVHELLNRWKGSQREVPAVARPFVGPEMLQWLDHATWRDAEHRVDWRIETRFLADAIHATGSNTFRADGDLTSVHISGEIAVDTSKIPGIPRLLQKKARAAIEPFIVRLITPNLTATNRSIERMLAGQNPA